MIHLLLCYMPHSDSRWHPFIFIVSTYKKSYFLFAFTVILKFFRVWQYVWVCSFNSHIILKRTLALISRKKYIYMISNLPKPPNCHTSSRSELSVFLLWHYDFLFREFRDAYQKWRKSDWFNVLPFLQS